MGDIPAVIIRVILAFIAAVPDALSHAIKKAYKIFQKDNNIEDGGCNEV
ncbi:hypothetical protein [Priestia abyssalis]|nr:hypothetical protein [Priestia abyssalis]